MSRLLRNYTQHRKFPPQLRLLKNLSLAKVARKNSQRKNQAIILEVPPSSSKWLEAKTSWAPIRVKRLSFQSETIEEPPMPIMYRVLSLGAILNPCHPSSKSRRSSRVLKRYLSWKSSKRSETFSPKTKRLSTVSMGLRKKARLENFQPLYRRISATKSSIKWVWAAQRKLLTSSSLASYNRKMQILCIVISSVKQLQSTPKPTCPLTSARRRNSQAYFSSSTWTKITALSVTIR